MRSFPSLLFLVTLVLAAGCGRRVDPRAQEGYDLVVQGRMDEAIAFTSAILADEPDNAQMRNVLGMALYKQGDVEASIEQYLEALEDDPGSAELHFNLGNSYEMLGRRDEAEKAFAGAIEHNEKFDLARLNLGLLYSETGRPELALQQWRRAVKDNDQFDLAYLQLGLLEAQLGNFEGAIPALERVLELRPTLKEVRVHLGNAYLQSGREGALQLAENEYRAALGIDAGFVDGLYSLGVVMAMQARPEEAIVAFEKAWRITRETPESPMHQQIEAYFRQAGYTPSPEGEEPKASG